MSLHLIILLLVLSSPTTAYEYPYKSCQGDNYTADSVFKSNLNLLLSSLSSPNSTYGTDTKGSAPNIAYGLFLCRGDISLSECRNCIKNATQGILQLCPNSKEATVWYETCQLRYSDLSFFTSYYDNYPINGTINNDKEIFTELEQELLKKLSWQAANNSSLKFATGTASTTTNHKPMIYGMVQCTRDLSGPKCYQCLQENFANLLNSFGAHEGGIVLSKSCNFRYEMYKFFEGKPTISLALPPSLPPVPSLPPPAPNQEDDRKGNRNVIIISVVSVGIAIVIVFLVIFAVRIFRRRTSAQSSHGTANPGEISRTESLYFDLSVLKAATANFSEVNKLGQGGFGAVYKGILPHGEGIAVKRLSAHSKQGIQELKNEIVLIAKLQHRNLVRLRGVCLEEGERLLVYEYMPNGSLDKFLFDPNKRKELNWEQRFKIIGGIARGLLYLHEESHLKIVHRDLKSSNILLDVNMKPKISDFGLARLFGQDETHAITCRVVGTFGYMAPEYARRGQFSTKLDVYSYGILVLEIVSGRKNNDFKYDSDHGLDLLSYAWKHWRSGKALKIIDKYLGEDYPRNEAFRCIQIGLLCAQEVPVNRPSMSSVFLMLNSPSMPLQDPLPPALLTGLSLVKSDVSSKGSSQQSYFCSTDRSSTGSFGGSQLSGQSNSPNPLEASQKGKGKVQSDSIRTFSSGETQAPPLHIDTGTTIATISDNTYRPYQQRLICAANGRSVNVRRK